MQSKGIPYTTVGGCAIGFSLQHLDQPRPIRGLSSPGTGDVVVAFGATAAVILQRCVERTQQVLVIDEIETSVGLMAARSLTHSFKVSPGHHPRDITP